MQITSVRQLLHEVIIAYSNSMLMVPYAPEKVMGLFFYLRRLCHRATTKLDVSTYACGTNLAADEGSTQAWSTFKCAY